MVSTNTTTTTAPAKPPTSPAAGQEGRQFLTGPFASALAAAGLAAVVASGDTFGNPVKPVVASLLAFTAVMFGLGTLETGQDAAGRAASFTKLMTALATNVGRLAENLDQLTSAAAAGTSPSA